MTKMLASVCTVEEAVLVLNVGVDIVDIKDPEKGALGALSIAAVKQIVEEINGQILVSATIGDHPYQADVIKPLILEMDNSGVDIVKVGVFGDIGDETVLEMLSDLSHQGIRIVLVLFAEMISDQVDLRPIAQAGITGVMIDTRDKLTGSLTDKLLRQQLFRFIDKAKGADLLCGLAGSLNCEDILDLLPVAPDYLGFRGALCMARQRVNGLNTAAVTTVRELIPIVEKNMVRSAINIGSS